MDNINLIHNLMVKACLSNSIEIQRKLVAQWESEIVIDDMDYSSMRLVPLFFYKNQQAGIFTKYDNRLKIIYKHWWLKTQHIVNQLNSVYETFKKHGIASVVIKGASIMTYYDKLELRPMADFDLLVKPADIKNALDLLKQIGYSPNRTLAPIVKSSPKLLTDFINAIDCKHTLTATEIDLHWNAGSFCSARFTEQLWLNLTDYGPIADAKKPKLAFEVFLTIVHAVTSENRDNLNWIIDISLLNPSEVVWNEARDIAVEEKKEKLFDYGCSLLTEFGIAAPLTVAPKKPRIPVFIFDEKEKNMFWFNLYMLKIQNLFLYPRYLFPEAAWFTKFYHLLRRVYFSVVLKRSEIQANRNS